MFMWHAIIFLISFDVSFNFEMKRKKSFTLRRKKRNLRVQNESTGNQTQGTDCKSDGLTTVLPRRPW